MIIEFWAGGKIRSKSNQYAVKESRVTSAYTRGERLTSVRRSFLSYFKYLFKNPFIYICVPTCPAKTSTELF